MIITENVKLNEKQTKYIHNNIEYERKSNCKINPFEMFNVGVYKGINTTLSRVLPYITDEEKKEISKQIRENNQQERQEKLDRGSFYHHQVEYCFNQLDIMYELEQVRAQNPFINWILANFTEEQILNAQCELSFIDTDLGYGGTVDLIIDNTLIDYKTGEKYDDHIIDAAAYFIPLKEQFQLKKVLYLYEVDFYKSNEVKVIDYTKYMDKAYGIFKTGLQYLNLKSSLKDDVSMAKKLLLFRGKK